MNSASKTPLTLLAVMAHPDDESFGAGATLARYADEGVNVHVIIATDGIAGSVESKSVLTNHSSLAQVRSGELSNAAAALGLTSIWSLPYRDSGMRGSADNEHPLALIRQPVEKTVAEVLGYIERLRPDVLITHDPYGGYGHPDHVRCCEATTAAFYQARAQSRKDSRREKRRENDSENHHMDHHGDYRESREGENARPHKLYYSCFDKRMLKMMVRVMRLRGQDPSAVGRNRDIDLDEISTWETPTHARIQVGTYLPRKQAASEAHASQYGGPLPFLRLLPPAARRRLQSVDSYTRAFPSPDDTIEHDLFAGLR